MTDAKEMWEAIKSRFGGNDESKKMQKYILEQQFESFFVSNLEGLHKGYDRFQSLLSQLETHGVGVSTKDTNQKFLRVFESDVKGSTGSFSSTQNVVFVSSNNTSSTNKVNTALVFPLLLAITNKKKALHYTLMISCTPSLLINPVVAMISTRLKKFYKKTGRKLHFDAKEPVDFDKSKVECFNGHNTGHFARECRSKGNQDSRRRDAGNTRYKTMDNGKRPAKQDEHKAMFTIDGEGVDWTVHAEDETEDYALMAFNSSNSGSNTQHNPHHNLKGKVIVGSGCSSHMTGNKAYLVDYQDFNGGPVAFGGSKGQIIGKGKIKTRKLDFEDVYFLKELQHFNLFFVSQMCDKKNKVLFTDTKCLVLSPDFKLPDENQGLFRVPRHHNMYSFNLENIVPSRGLACLIAKATVDESTKWHRRSKGIKWEYNNARTPKQNGVAEIKNRTLIEAARTMLADLFLHNTFWAEAVNTACYVLHMVLVTKPQNKTPYELLTGKFEEKSDEGFLVGYSLSGKAFRPITAENKANKIAGPKETNNSTGTQDGFDTENSEMKADHAQEYYVMPLWYAYTSTFKSSDPKNGDQKLNGDTGSKKNEEPVDQEDQAFLEELKRLKRQEKEATW
nr:ribonuclease H-like domain-containing protein [Tanacetum cinerariifolium]